MAITARVEGIREKRHFTEGADAKKGQLLDAIDPSKYELSSKNAQGALEQCKAVGAGRVPRRRRRPLR